MGFSSQGVGSNNCYLIAADPVVFTKSQNIETFVCRKCKLKYILKYIYTKYVHTYLEKLPNLNYQYTWKCCTQFVELMYYTHNSIFCCIQKFSYSVHLTVTLKTGHLLLE